MLSTHATLATLALLGALLGAAYLMVGTVITPLILMTYLVGHIGFSTHARLRQAHESTIRGFVKVVEALDPYTKGHTERVAHLCRIIGEEMGLDWERMERLRWAALLHDVSKLAVPGDLPAARRGRLLPEHYEAAARHRLVVEGVLAEVDFLRPMVEITSAADRPARRRRLRGEPPRWKPASWRLRMCSTARTTTRSYREAITQAEAFASSRPMDDRFGRGCPGCLRSGGGRIVARSTARPTRPATARLDEQVRERAIRA